jgi:hypothetical protein
MPSGMGLAGASVGYQMPTVIGAPCGSAAWTTVKPALAARAGEARPQARAASEARSRERIDMDVLDGLKTVKVMPWPKASPSALREWANGFANRRTDVIATV